MRVVVTAREDTSARLAAPLRAAGLEVVELPLIGIEPLDGPAVRAEGHDWLVVTSRAAVECLFRRLEGPLPPVAAIGPGTAEALREHGVEPAVVAARSTQEGLVAEFPQPAGRVLFAGASDARDLLARELGADVVLLYRTIETRPREFPDADLAVVASASAACALARIRTDVPCVSIGPATTAAAREQGLTVVAEAESHDLDGLVTAVKLAASDAASSPS